MNEAEERVIALLINWPDGITLIAIKNHTKLTERKIRAVLLTLERAKLLGAYMRQGIFYYSYYEWKAQTNGNNENNLPSEMVRRDET